MLLTNKKFYSLIRSRFGRGNPLKFSLLSFIGSRLVATGLTLWFLRRPDSNFQFFRRSYFLFDFGNTY
ncbi:MAG: hypothetical protein A3K30_04200 [Deltaproteobacteria bacterium RBG_13_51_10]|nr:MAG: hypothetical protein A3K30_04200 [Deltaproteobacteria bacterium RBG_13_51_10]